MQCKFARGITVEYLQLNWANQNIVILDYSFKKNTKAEVLSKNIPILKGKDINVITQMSCLKTLF